MKIYNSEAARVMNIEDKMERPKNKWIDGREVDIKIPDVNRDL